MIDNKEVTITGYTHDGRGLANVDGKVVFVSGALAGETVSLITTKKRTQFDESIAEEITDPSPHRVAPKCEHFGVCGGCKLQYIDPAEQINIKQAALLDQLQRTSNIRPEIVMPAITGPTWQYRHKARLGVKFVHKKDKVLVGFREVNARYVADINRCHVLHASIGDKLPALSELIASLSCYQQIPQLEIAVGDEITAMIVRHLKPFVGGDIEKLKTFGQQHNIHIYLQPKGPKTIAKLWPVDNVDRLFYQLDNLTFAFHPADFTQVNPDINRKMVARAIEFLDLQKDDRVLDLFCGLGNFSLPIAKNVREVIGVEGSDDMVERCRENAQANAIDNVAFYCADLFQDHSTEDWAKKQYDKVLIDPPRSGAKEIIPTIATWRPSRVVYVSCNPATLARDAGELTKIGYHCQTAGVLDMFPHTHHVESIALFIRKD